MKESISTFFALVRAGLWEKDVKLSQFGCVDLSEIYRLAEEQSVVGLVAAGLDHVVGVKLPKGDVLQFVGQALQLEQRNNAMNDFIAILIDKMRNAGIYSVLVKGQGVAQCYERPLWRSSGDVDLLLSDSNYEKARELLHSLSAVTMPYERYSKHLGMTIDSWLVEIHGTLRTGLSRRVDKAIDDVQKDVFYGGNVRLWNNGSTTVFLPAPDNDVFFVFTHFLMHFYREGMNLRQICDWCRLLWTYRETINHKLLESRICKAGLMTEWKSFAALAVEYLGMSVEAMPYYDTKFKNKGERLLKHILKGSPYNVICDTWAIFKIFPLQTLKFSPSIFLNVNRLKIKERLFGNG